MSIYAHTCLNDSSEFFTLNGRQFFTCITISFHNLLHKLDFTYAGYYELHVLQYSCARTAVFMCAYCSIHLNMLQCSCVHTAVFMSTCHGIHVCILQYSCAHPAVFLCAYSAK